MRLSLAKTAIVLLADAKLDSVTEIDSELTAQKKKGRRFAALPFIAGTIGSVRGRHRRAFHLGETVAHRLLNLLEGAHLDLAHALA